MSCKKRTHVHVHIVSPKWDFMMLLLKSFHQISRMCTSTVHVGTPNTASVSSDHARIYPTHERLRKLHVSIFMFDFLLYFMSGTFGGCVHACVVVIKHSVSRKRVYSYIIFHYRFYVFSFIGSPDGETLSNNGSIITIWTASSVFIGLLRFIYLIITGDCVFNLPFTVLFTCLFEHFWLKKLLNQSIAWTSTIVRVLPKHRPLKRPVKS